MINAPAHPGRRTRAELGRGFDRERTGRATQPLRSGGRPPLARSKLPGPQNA